MWDGRYYANLIATALAFHIYFLAITCGIKVDVWIERCVLGRKVWHVSVVVRLQIILHHAFMCRGAIRRFKLNTLVSGKLWSVCVLFQEGGIQIWSVFAIFIACMCFFLFFLPDPTVTTRHLHQIFHIMVFVLVHSMRLLLVKRQLHKMMSRTMRRLGGIFFFPAVPCSSPVVS